MRSSWIGIETDLFARRLKLLLQFYNRLRRLEGVVLGKVAEVGGLCGAIVQTSIGGIKDDDGGDLLGQRDGCIKRVGAAQRETDHTDRAAAIRRGGSAVFAQVSQRAANVAAHPLLLLVQRSGQRLRLLDRRGRFAMVEVGGECNVPRRREPVACLAKRLRQSPPCMQNHHS